MFKFLQKNEKIIMIIILSLWILRLLTPSIYNVWLYNQTGDISEYLSRSNEIIQYIILLGIFIGGWYYLINKYKEDEGKKYGFIMFLLGAVFFKVFSEIYVLIVQLITGADKYFIDPFPIIFDDKFLNLPILMQLLELFSLVSIFLVPMLCIYFIWKIMIRKK